MTLDCNPEAAVMKVFGFLLAQKLFDIYYFDKNRNFQKIFKKIFFVIFKNFEFF